MLRLRVPQDLLDMGTAHHQCQRFKGQEPDSPLHPFYPVDLDGIVLRQTLPDLRLLPFITIRLSAISQYLSLRNRFQFLG